MIISFICLLNEERVSDTGAMMRKCKTKIIEFFVFMFSSFDLFLVLKQGQRDFSSHHLYFILTTCIHLLLVAMSFVVSIDENNFFFSFFFLLFSIRCLYALFVHVLLSFLFAFLRVVFGGKKTNEFSKHNSPLSHCSYH